MYFFLLLILLIPLTSIASEEPTINEGSQEVSFMENRYDGNYSLGIASDKNSKLHIFGINNLNHGDKVCLATRKGISDAYISGSSPSSIRYSKNKPATIPFVTDFDWDSLYLYNGALAAKGTCSETMQFIPIVYKPFSEMPETIRIAIIDRAKKVYLEKVKAFINNKWSRRDPKEYKQARLAVSGETPLKIIPILDVSLFNLGEKTIAYITFKIQPDLEEGQGWLRDRQEFQYIVKFNNAKPQLLTNLIEHKFDSEEFLLVLSIIKDKKTNSVIISTYKEVPDSSTSTIYILHQNKLEKIYELL